MASNFGVPEPSSRLQEYIDRVRRRYAELEPSYARPAAPGAPAAPTPEQEEGSIESILSGLGAVQESLHQNLVDLPVNLASGGTLARDASQWMQQSPKSWYRDETIPREVKGPPAKEPVPANTLARSAYVPPTEATDSEGMKHAKEVARSIMGRVVDMGDPTNVALLAAFEGLPLPALVKTAANLGFGVQMAKATWDAADEAYQLARQEGWTPAVSGKAAEAALDGALLALPIASHIRGRLGRGRPAEGATEAEGATPREGGGPGEPPREPYVRPEVSTGMTEAEATLRAQHGVSPETILPGEVIEEAWGVPGAAAAPGREAPTRGPMDRDMGPGPGGPPPPQGTVPRERVGEFLEQLARLREGADEATRPRIDSLIAQVQTLRAVDQRIMIAERLGQTDQLGKLVRLRAAVEDGIRGHFEEAAARTGGSDAAVESMREDRIARSDPELMNLKGRLEIQRNEARAAGDETEAAELDAIIGSIENQLRRPGRMHGPKRPEMGGPAPEPAPPSEPGPVPADVMRPLSPGEPPPAAPGPPIPVGEGGTVTATRPAPPPPPPVEAPPVEAPPPTEAPPAGKPVRGDVGQAPGGGWRVRSYDRQGNVVEEVPAKTKREAQEALRLMQPALQQNRREERESTLSPQEHELVTGRPEEATWPTEDSLELNQEWYDNGKNGRTPALYRALVNARQIGVDINPAWYDIFPDLAEVQTVGKRVPIRPAPVPARVAPPEEEEPTTEAGPPREPEAPTPAGPTPAAPSQPTTLRGWQSELADPEAQPRVHQLLEKANDALKKHNPKADVSLQIGLNRAGEPFIAIVQGDKVIDAPLSTAGDTLEAVIDRAKAKGFEVAGPKAEPLPGRTLRIGRGAHGQVKVVFPNQIHADLYSLIGRMRKKAQGKPGTPPNPEQVAHWLKVPPDQVGALAGRYRDHINQLIKPLEEGAEFQAPSIESLPPIGQAPPQEMGGFRIGEKVRVKNGKIGTIGEFAAEGQRVRVDFETQTYKGHKRRHSQWHDLDTLESTEAPPAPEPEEEAPPPQLPLEPEPEGPQEMDGWKAGQRVRTKGRKEGVIREFITLPDGRKRALVFFPDIQKVQYNDLDTLTAIEEGAPPAPAAELPEPIEAELARWERVGQPPEGIRETVAEVLDRWMKAAPEKDFTFFSELEALDDGESPGAHDVARAVEKYVQANRPPAPRRPGQRPLTPRPPSSLVEGIKTLVERELKPEQAEALERWIAARKLEGKAADEVRAAAKHLYSTVVKLKEAEADKAAAYRLQPGPSLKKAEIARRKKATRMEVENAEMLVRLAKERILKAAPEAARSLLQIAEDRIPVRGAKAAPTGLQPITQSTIDALANSAGTSMVDFDTLAARVQKYTPTAQVDDEVLTRTIEADFNAAAKDSRLLARLVKDSPAGMGAKAIEALVKAGPQHSSWKKYLAHRRRQAQEARALAEAVAEDGSSILIPIGSESELATLAGAMAAELEQLPANENPVLPWDVVDPATGKPVLARAALAALESKSGRLYARIAQKFADNTAGEAADEEVPFDVPEADGQDIPPFEEEDRPPSVLGMPLGKKAIKTAQLALSFTPPREPKEVTSHVPSEGAPGSPSATLGDRQPPRVPGTAGGASRPVAGGERPPGNLASGGARFPRPGEVAGVPQRPSGAPRGRFGVITVREEFARQADSHLELVAPRLQPHLTEDQQAGVGRAVHAMSQAELAPPAVPQAIIDQFRNVTDSELAAYILQEAGMASATAQDAAQAARAELQRRQAPRERGGAFLLADGTGVGKTREILAVADHFAHLGHPVLIVAPANVLNIPKTGPKQGQVTGSYADDSRAMGINLNLLRVKLKDPKGPELRAGAIHLVTYEFLAKMQVTPQTVVVYDEAHYIKTFHSTRGAAGQLFAERATAVLFATATPGDQAHHLMYMKRIGLLEGKNEDQALRDLGMVSEMISKRDPVTGQEGVVKVWKPRSKTLMQKRLNQLFQRLTARGTTIKREINFSEVPVEFVSVPVSAERLAELNKIEQAFAGPGAMARRMLLMHQRRQLEPDKLEYVQQEIERSLAEGRKVVVFAQRLRLSKVIKRTKVKIGGETVTLEELITETEGTLHTLRDWLQERKISYAEIHGEAPNKADEMERFMRGQADVVIATVESGGTGISLDDRKGDAPRTMIIMTAPLESTSFVQAAGRVHRLPTKSLSRIVVLISEHPVDAWNKDIIATKIAMQGALVSGAVKRLDPNLVEQLNEFGDPDLPGQPQAPKQARHTTAEVLAKLTELSTWHGQVQNPKPIVSDSQYRLHRKVIEKLGATIDTYGEFSIPTKDGQVTGTLTHPKIEGGRTTLRGTFSWGEPLAEEMERTYAGRLRLVQDVERVIEAAEKHPNWAEFLERHRDAIESIFDGDADLFSQLLGATSAATEVKTNVALALKAYLQLRRGEPFRGFMESTRRNLEAIRQEQAISGPKIAPYTAALRGDWSQVWVDRHIGRFFYGRENLKGGASPSPEQRRHAEEAMREAAEELGWEPAKVSSVIWAAQQIAEGVPEEEINEYPAILERHEVAIRRFLAYFGPHSRARGGALRLVANPPARESEAGFEEDATGGHSLPLEAQLDAAREVLKVEEPLPVPHVLNAPELPRAADHPEWKYLGSVLAGEFGRNWSIKWEGHEVRTVEDLAALAQIARNPALEQSSLLLVKDGKIVTSILSGAGLPGSVAPLPPGWTPRDIQLQLHHHNADGWYIVHNHPGGRAWASINDVIGTHALVKAVGGRGFKGHVITDHGTYSVITPQDVADIEKASPGQRKRAALRIKQRKAPQALRETLPPDPALKEGISAEDYWNSYSYVITREEQFIQHYVRNLSSRSKDRPDWPIVVLLDSGGRIRATLHVDPRLFYSRKRFREWLAARQKEQGARQVIAVVPGSTLGSSTVGRSLASIAAEGRGLGVTFDETVSDYLLAGDLSGVIDPMNPLTAGKIGAALPRFNEPLGVEFEEDDDTPYVPSAGGGQGQGGAPPPPSGPPWGAGPGPGDDGWDRRVRFAEDRLDEEGPWGPRRIYDAILAGVARFVRGLRDFARWATSMRFPGIGPFLRSIWSRITRWFRPQATLYETRGRVRGTVADATAAAIGLERPTIRPIPDVKASDVETALRRLREGPPGRQGTGKPPDLAVNINRIADESDIRNLIATIVRALESRFGEARSYRSWAEAKLKALEAGLTEEDFLRLVREKGALTDHEILAGRLLRQEAGIDFQQKRGLLEDLERQLRDTNAEANPEQFAALEQRVLEARREMNASLQKLIGITYGTVAAGSEAGRALAIHRMWVESLTPEERFLRRFMRGREIPEAELQRLVDALREGDIDAVNRIIRRIHRPTLLQKTIEYFINSILSGPATLGANVMGNWNHEVLLRTPERGLAGFLEQRGIRQAVERLLTGEASAQERVPGEMMEAWRALTKYRFGFMSALKEMWHATWNERYSFGAKGEFRPPAIGGTLGKIVRTPSRWMEALDVGAKYAAAASERAAQVWRKAVLEARGQGWTEEQIRARATEIDRLLERYSMLEEQRRADPTELTRDDYAFLARNRDLGAIYKAMQHAANVSTFRDETTQFSKYVKLLRGRYPWLTFFVPFINTPERILVQAVRRTPIGLLRTLENIRSGKIKGGEASDRLAQGILGTAVSAGLYMLAKDGLITGGGPADPEERRNWLATGKQPYAVRVGNTWVSLARIEPLATTLGFAADLAEAQDEKIAGDVFDKLHYSVVNNIANKTYLEGIVSAAEAVGDPDRYGARLWKRMVGAAVPNLFARAAIAIDPTIRQTDSIQDTLLSRVPWFSQRVPARLTGTGEPIVRGEEALSRFASPFRYSPEAGPERNLERLFLEAGYNPSAPPRSMTLPGTNGRQIMLTAEEREAYAAYAQRATAFARKLAADGDWSSLDAYAKEEVLKRIYRFAHDAARRRVYHSIAARVRSGKFELKAS